MKDLFNTGDTFTIDGKKYKCKPARSAYDCAGCDLKDQHPCIDLICTPVARGDGKSVIFVELK